MTDAAALRFADGTCRVLCAFDVGREIDLALAPRRLGSGAATRTGPPARERAPVRCAVALGPVPIDGRTITPTAAATIYDFGAVAIDASVPATGPVGDVARLAAALAASEPLVAAFRVAVDDLVRRLGDAVADPRVDPRCETFVVIHVRGHGADRAVGDWPVAHGPQLAALLRADPAPLSTQEVGDVLSQHVVSGAADLVAADRRAALVVREDADDVVGVLTFAVVQLLEMRVLDARLDASLEASYETVLRHDPRIVIFPAAHRGALEQIARRQIDAALLFEHVRNAPKLLDDPFLSRVYEVAAHRFRLRDWDDSIHRKIEVLGTIYERLRDRSAILRAEVLEWIVILLILVSIVLPFVVPTATK